MILETLLGEGFRFPEGRILMSLQALKENKYGADHSQSLYMESPESLLGSATKFSCAVGADAPVVAGCVSPLEDALGAR